MREGLTAWNTPDDAGPASLRHVPGVPLATHHHRFPSPSLSSSPWRCALPRRIGDDFDPVPSLFLRRRAAVVADSATIAYRPMPTRPSPRPSPVPRTPIVGPDPTTPIALLLRPETPLPLLLTPDTPGPVEPAPVTPVTPEPETPVP